MIKKVLILITLFFWIFSLNNVFADNVPSVNCIWLPWCVDSDIKKPSGADISNNLWSKVISSIIWETIQFVAVIAVIALILSAFMYLLSWWDEEKAKKAKSWVTWSLVWVILSISAWGIINMLNNLIIK